MDNVAKVLMSSNGVIILLLIFIGVAVFMMLGKGGYFSLKTKSLSIGRSEGEIRATILKQKEFVLQYCSYLTQNIISDLVKMGVEVTYVNVDYIVEKVVDEWLGWLLVNHISEDKAYLELKTQQTKLIMLKAIGRVDASLLQDEKLSEYFNGICKRVTEDIIKGVLSVYKMESR